MTFILSLLLLPGTLLAEAGTDCRYPAGLGGPFDGLPGFPDQCTPGLHHEPLTVCVDDQIFPPDIFGDGAVEPYVPLCHGEEPCLEVLGHYNSASGTVFPLMADDDDHVYFWSGRWHLHALDKRGNLRWRYDFCLPERHSACAWHGLDNNCDQSGQPVISWGPPTFLDYDGNLFFFMGDELHVLSSEGELLLKHRVVIPGITPDDDSDVIISIGSGRGVSATFLPTYVGADAPALQTDGTFWVGYDQLSRDLQTWSTGFLHLDRTGKVLDYIDDQALAPGEHLSNQGTVLDSQERLLAKATYSKLNADTQRFKRAPGHLTLIEDGQVTRAVEVHGIEANGGTDGFQHESSEVSPVVDPLFDRSYQLSTSHGDIYALNHADGDLRRMVNFDAGSFSFSYQNRPVLDENGTLYLVHDKMNAGSRLFAFDTDYLWNNPQDSTLPMAQWLNHDGVVWSATTPRLNAAQALSWSTPVLGQGNRLYTGLAGFAAVDTTNGEVLWVLAMLWMGRVRKRSHLL